MKFIFRICTIVWLSACQGVSSAPLLQQDTINDHWIAAWTAMPQLTEPANLPSASFNQSPKFFDTTIRQTVKLDIPTTNLDKLQLRVRISNAFGLTPLRVGSISIALPLNNTAGYSEIIPSTAQNITFNNGMDAGVAIPNAALAVSDPLSIDLSTSKSYVSRNGSQAGSIISISMYLPNGQDGEAITSHPGSRVNTYLTHGNHLTTANLTGEDTQKLAHWYLISAVEVLLPPPASTFVIVGDSITDGRGSDTDLNNRWPDLLFTRLQLQPQTRNIAIANQAAGGNRVLADGLGPSVLSRIDRDVLAQPGLKYAMIFEGVNDIGVANATITDQKAIYHDLVAAYRQVIARIHAKGIPCFGATITPFGNPNTTVQPYSDPVREQTRLAINDWIRNSKSFDAVIDFDAAIRDPNNATMIAAAYDSGDGLHPNAYGYQAMANAFPIDVFA